MSVEVTCWRCGRRHVELGTICPTHGRLPPGFRRQVLAARTSSRASSPAARAGALVVFALASVAMKACQVVGDARERHEQRGDETIERRRAELERMLDARRAAQEQSAADGPVIDDCVPCVPRCYGGWSPPERRRQRGAR